MKNYGMFKRYDYSNIPNHPLTGVPNVICIRNDDGQDFYDLRNGMLPDEPSNPRFYFCVTSKGEVVVASTSIDRTFPQDCYLISIDPTDEDIKSYVGKKIDIERGVFINSEVNDEH